MSRFTTDHPMASQPSRFDTANYFRWLLLALTIGGGFTGLVVTLQVLEQQKPTGLFSDLFYYVGIALYIFIIVSGLLFADDARCIIPLRIAFFLQIPWISSPLLVYGFSSGFRVTVGLLDWKFGASFLFGSDFDISVFENHPWGFGINLFALVILILLARFGRTPNTSMEPTATALADWTNR